MDGLAIGVVVGGCRVGWQRRDRCGEGGWTLFGAGGCWGASVRTMIGSAGITVTDLDCDWIVRPSGTLRLVGDLGVRTKGCWLSDLRCWSS